MRAALWARIDILAWVVFMHDALKPGFPFPGADHLFLLQTGSDHPSRAVLLNIFPPMDPYSKKFPFQDIAIQWTAPIFTLVIAKLKKNRHVCD